MSTKTPPGGAQTATPSDRSSSLTARNAQLGHVYYWNGDAVQVTQKDEDGSVRVQLVTGWGDDGKPSSLGARVIRLLGDRSLMRTTTLPALEEGPPRVPPAPVELPDGLRGTPKPNPGGHHDRARIEAALPTMTEEQLTELLDRDRRAFVGPLVNNERARREAEQAKAAARPKPLAAPAPSRIEWTDAAPPRSPVVSATTSPTPPRGLPVASGPPSYPAPPTPKRKAAPSPPTVTQVPAPAPAPSPSPSFPTDDRAERARSALAVLSQHAPALVECAAAYKELEALGLTAPRFM